jgi:hypothetical protein
MIKSRMMRWARHVARMGKKKMMIMMMMNACTILMGNSERNNQQENLDVNDRIIIKGTLNKECGAIGTGLILLWL